MEGGREVDGRCLGSKCFILPRRLLWVVRKKEEEEEGGEEGLEGGRA